MARNDITEVVRLYVEEGKTLRDIVGRLGASCETVRSKLVNAAYRRGVVDLTGASRTAFFDTPGY